jgi:hypothetical protein
MQENEVMSAMLKSLGPKVQAARDERMSAERIMRTQLFDYKERLARAEDNLQAANALIRRLERHISTVGNRENDGRVRGKACIRTTWEETKVSAAL